MISTPAISICINPTKISELHICHKQFSKWSHFKLQRFDSLLSAIYSTTDLQLSSPLYSAHAIDTKGEGGELKPIPPSLDCQSWTDLQNIIFTCFWWTLVEEEAHNMIKPDLPNI